MSQLKLFNGDCTEVLLRIKAGTIDLTVTSPPYDDLRTYNGNVNAWNETKWKSVIGELYYITKPGGVVVWVVGDATTNGSESGTSFKQALYAKECGFNLHDTMIYEKVALSFPGSQDRRYYSFFEYMFVWSKGEPKTFNPIRDRVNTTAGRPVRGRERRPDGSMGVRSCLGNKAGYYSLRSNIWRIPTNNTDGNSHPAIFPDALARDHIISWSNPGDTVLDPFLGSGTTGKMALLLGRKFIGIELDPTYYSTAKQRCEAALEQSNSGLYKRHEPPVVRREDGGLWK